MGLEKSPVRISEESSIQNTESELLRIDMTLARNIGPVSHGLGYPVVTRRGLGEAVPNRPGHDALCSMR